MGRGSKRVDGLHLVEGCTVLRSHHTMIPACRRSSLSIVASQQAKDHDDKDRGDHYGQVTLDSIFGPFTWTYCRLIHSKTTFDCCFAWASFWHPVSLRSQRTVRVECQLRGHFGWKVESDTYAVRAVIVQNAANKRSGELTRFHTSVLRNSRVEVGKKRRP